MGAFNIDDVSAHSTSDLVDLAQSCIDDESARVQLQLCALKTRRNTLSLVSRLPPEILSNVFIWHAAIAREHPPDPKQGARVKWIEATNLCRHWRYVALDSPRLWNRIVARTPFWTEELLRRSRSAPLMIESVSPELRSHDEFVRRSTEMALMHIPRVVSLRLKAEGPDMEHYLATLAAPAHAVEILVLQNESVFSSIAPALDGFCTGLSPALRHLDLSRCSIPWNLMPLHNLTALKLKNPLSRMTVRQMLSILRRTPSLETLLLCFACLIESHSDLQENAIELPKLTSLRLYEATPECAGLLVPLVFPATTTVVVDCNLEFYDPDLPTIVSLVDAISKVGQGLRSLDIRASCFRHRNNLCCRGYETSDPSASFEPKIVVQIPGNEDRSAGWASDTIIPDVCRGFPLTQLRHLEVRSPRLSLESLGMAWVDMFGMCSHLRHLSVSLRAEDMAALVAALNPSHVEDALRTASPFLPALDYLELIGMELDCFDELRSCIWYRREYGAELRKLVFRTCPGVQPYLFEDIVTVDWNTYCPPSSNEHEYDPYDQLIDYEDSL
ncbi:hypothetical protein PLICRDRAFT_700122 [Plicaturopsis crispa FD-325 SS-3]|nr:hypothetical protein PLICRDRAFT_700122 [Plicaturopsis crispa FD-325 SS-3]